MRDPFSHVLLDELNFVGNLIRGCFPRSASVAAYTPAPTVVTCEPAATCCWLAKARSGLFVEILRHLQVVF